MNIAQFIPRDMPAGEFYVGLAGAVILLVSLVIFFTDDSNSMSSKIKAIQERRKTLQSNSAAPQKRKRPETSVNFMRAVAIKLQLIKKNQMGKSESRLIEAGYRSKDSVYVLAFFNLIFPVVLGMIGFIYMRYNAAHITTFRGEVINYLWPIGSMYFGLKMPSMYVDWACRKRYQRIIKSLPDVLDLMTICAEAGLSLTSMLDRVARELAISYPEMAEELSMTSIEIGFLPDRNKALSNLAERCKLREVRGIVSVFIQTEKYGTPIAQALRVLSAEFRQARMLKAEGKAAQLPALMTVPMIVFILPTLFIIIMAPAMVKIMDMMPGS